MSSVFEIKAEGGAKGAVDLQEVHRAARLFADPESGLVLQSPFGGQRIVRGNDVEAIAAAVVDLSADPCVYWHLHPVGIGATQARVGEHVRRRWFLVDIDRQKTEEDKDLSASDSEKEQSRTLAAEVLTYLSDRGWPQPIQVDSGNGWHLYYRVDLPNDEPARLLFKGALSALHERFAGDAQGEIDPKPYPATAGGKMPGTWAANRKAQADRPHRMCRLVYVPDTQQVVSAELLGQLAAEAPKPEPRNAPLSPLGRGDGGEGAKSPFEVRAGTLNGATAYGKTVCERVAGEIAMAPSGTRQQALWNGACRLGELVAARELEEFEACDKLYVAACRAGLDSDVNCGERAVRDTIKRGLAQGKTNPKPAPGRDDSPVSSAPVTANTTVEKDAKATKPAVEIYTLPQLMAMDLPPTRWAVPGILSEGLSVLAGKPKMGKSWVALNLAITVACGGQALGSIQVEAGDVLYLSLEDRLRRVKLRAGKVLAGLRAGAAERLSVAVQWPRAGSGGLASLDDWMRAAPRPSLLVIDVWTHFRAPSVANRDKYEQDYEQASAVKDLADRHGCSTLVIHHLRKGGAEDPLEQVSGTMGLTGCADGVLVLTRARNENEAKLMLTGRDVEEKELALRFDPAQCIWTCEGNAEQVELGRTRRMILDLLSRRPAAHYSGPDIALELKANPTTVRKTLNRMHADGQIDKRGNTYSVAKDSRPDEAEF